MKDLRVELKLKNNLLYNAIMSKYASVAAFCRENSLHQNLVGGYLNFKSSPISKQRYRDQSQPFLADGQYVKKSALDIAKALGCNFFDVFPPVSYESKNNKFIAEIDSTEFLPYNDSKYFPVLDEEPECEFSYKLLDKAVCTLTDNEQYVLSHRFGLNGANEMTLAECGEKLGVTQERVRQIEAKALRKMRHPSRSRGLKRLLEKTP